MGGFDYTRAQFASALRAVGLKKGDVVFSHSNVGYFGLPESGRTASDVVDTILGAFTDVIGEEGTLVVPTFTYSFARCKTFDREKTPSECGMFTEALRRLPASIRSNDPLFSVAALGFRAKELTENIPAECFGINSFWDRFMKADGIIVNLNFDAGSTFIHYVERSLDVPYRYDKFFFGRFADNGTERSGTAVFFCQDFSNQGTVAVFEPFDLLAHEEGLVRTATVGRGSILSISAKDTFKLIEQRLPSDPWFLTQAGVDGYEPELIRPPKRFSVSMPDNATMSEMVDAVWQLPRDIVSDGYTAALEALATQVPMTIHKYKTGTSCWDWIVPERWCCHEAYLETMDGEKIFSYADHPLHVASYSQPFEGEVTREELFKHLKTHPRLRDGIPFEFYYYKRDWGLCCSQETKEKLTDERYRVLIRSQFSYGELAVGEVVVPGESDESIVLCAHLCHPAQVNDDLTGVVVGIDVMRALMNLPRKRYTYRLLIVPETIGSLAYLHQNEQLIPSMKGGLFLEMLGLDNAHSLQLSFSADTSFDRVCRTALTEYDPAGRVGKFLRVVTNDERQFNAPGIRVPMLSLSRVEEHYGDRNDSYSLYSQYHSHLDNPSVIPDGSLEGSRDLILKIIDTWEADRVPINLFKGEVFLSRHGIYFDFDEDFEASMALFEVMFEIDGTASISQIAKRCSVSFGVANRIVDRLHEKGLVIYADEHDCGGAT